MDNELTIAIKELENDAGLKEGFFDSLLQEDDWSFIIKLHALYEAAVTNVITNKLGESSLEGFISRLELSDRNRGKLKIAKDLSLLDTEERKFIYALSEIRNSFVHSVLNTKVNLEEYFNNLSSNKLKDYIKTFGYTYQETIEIADRTVNSSVFTRENPKIAIWQNSMHVLAVISCITATERSKNTINKTICRIYEMQNK